MPTDLAPRTSILLSVALSLGLIASAGCDRKQDQAQRASAAEAATVTLAPSKLDSVQRTIGVVGTLYGDEEAQISAKVAGRVVKTLVDVGDRVPSGAPLAQIEPTDYELARRQAETGLMQTLAKLGLADMPSADFNPETTPTVQQAKLQADNADARFRRSEKLFKQQPPLISEQDYEDTRTAAAVAKSAYDVALLAARSLVAEAKARQADLNLAEQRLADATVRAPQQDGRQYAVAAKMVSVGEYIKDGTPLFRVVSDNPIRYRAGVPERYLGDVKEGQSVSVQVEAYPQVFEGVLRRINPQVERESRQFTIEVNVANDKGLLRPGAFATGAVATRKQEGVTFVPKAAVVTFAGSRKVFTVKDGKAVEHQVAIGDTKGDYIEITKGLEGTPEVVVTGAGRLAGGTPVQVKSAATQGKSE